MPPGIIERLREYQLPDGVLPLAKSRLPFLRLSDDAITAAIHLSQVFPEKRGRLTSAIRDELGSRCPATPAHHLTIEVHLDSTRLSTGVADRTVAIGFEPDHFVSVLPKGFHEHYTLLFVAARSDQRRIGLLRGEAEQRLEDVARLLERDETAQAYLEAEIYDSSLVRHYAWRPPDNLSGFPLAAGALHSFTPPCVFPSELSAANAKGKVADIHVKTPATKDQATTEFRAAMCSAGFYEVVTEAGNHVLTAQFVDMADAKEVFRRLDCFLSAVGGASQMKLEPCFRLWRKVVRHEPTQLTEVPPVVRLVGSSQAPAVASSHLRFARYPRLDRS